MLLLAKALVDAINSKMIKAMLKSEEAQSLVLLELLVAAIASDPSAVRPLRNVYRLRSSGGVVHLSGDSRKKTYEAAGINDLLPADVVSKVAADIAASLEQIAAWLADPEGVGRRVSEYEIRSCGCVDLQCLVGGAVVGGKGTIAEAVRAS